MYDFSLVGRFMEDVMRVQHGVPGCDVMVTRGHELLYRHTCGVSDYESKKPVAGNELYYMYSCTKPLTVTCGLRLWEEGLLDLDAPVADYLPAFRDVFLLKGGQRVPPVNPPTVRHLFTMSAGLDYAGGGEAEAELLEKSQHTAGTVEIVNTYASRPLCFEPGHEFLYSNCHDVLAAVIEVVSGMKFADYMAKVIFDPLGMSDSTFDETDAVRARLAAQYVSDPQGRVTPTDLNNWFIVTPNYQSGGAGLITSTADYAKFADALACGGMGYNGYRLLKPETVVMLHTEQLHTFVMNNNFSCAAGPGYGYGLGVRTRIEQVNGARSPIGEFGWDGAAGAYVMMDDLNQLSIAFSMHVLSWPFCIGYDHGTIRDMVYDVLGL
ncbi:MAG: beta-lactamase family protein [Clostridia bacterium]|nr:beta-lactamase family protein [Clostridia bacterium]